MAADAQSMTDKIAGKFGFPSGSDANTEVDTPVEAAPEQEIEATNDDAFAELDWEGQTVKVPKGVKEALMRNDDYTRKTQELAENRKAVDQLRELAQTRQLESVFADSIAAEQQEINVIDAYLQQAVKLDWGQMSTDQMLRHKVDMDNIKERRAMLADAINGKRSTFTTNMQSKINELRGKSRELASKSIQGFGEETEKAVRAFALAEGLNESEIDNVLLDPRSYKILWKAAQFDKVKAGSTEAGNKASKIDRVLRPGAAGERMPASTASKLNFQKAMNNAKTSSQKAQVIEERLAGSIFKGK